MCTDLKISGGPKYTIIKESKIIQGEIYENSQK